LGGQKAINTNDLYNLDANQLAKRVTSYQQLGVKWARFDFDWSVIQPDNATSFDYSGFDAAVQALTTAHIAILGIIDYTPSWANGGQPTKYYPPLHDSNFATFAANLAAHFGPMGVHYWEIWNEPNLASFWSPAADPVGYTALLKAAYRAIHDVDSDALVMSGGLADPTNNGTNIDARDFLRDIYQDGAKGFFDAFAYHPYCTPDMPGNPDHNPWQQMFATAPSLLSIMSDNGDTKTIWLTEFGAPTSGDDETVVSERRQARMIKQAFELAESYSWAGPLFIYNLMDFHDYGYTKNPLGYYGSCGTIGHKNRPILFIRIFLDQQVRNAQTGSMRSRNTAQGRSQADRSEIRQRQAIHAISACAV
jgi:hypothetical protein